MSPIYEYECEKCGKFEHIHLKVNEELTKCPKCDKVVKKLVPTGVGVKFMGFGFPGNDSKNPPPPPSSTNKKTLQRKRRKLRDRGYQNDFHPKG